MANDNKAWNQGVKDANAGKGMTNTYGKPATVAKQYEAGYLKGKKDGK